MHFIADRHDFINADAAFKAFAAAAVAANRAVEFPILSQVRIGKAGFFQCRNRRALNFAFAVWTQSAQQPLRHNQADRAGDVERRNTHVQKAGQRGRCIIGMQGRENHVAGLGGFNGDVGGFQVTNLTDHNNIRVLTQEGSECGSKRQTLFFIDVDLVDARQVNLGRIFCRRNVHIFRVQNTQAGIERNGFARTCRTGNQHHAVRAVDGFQQHFFLESL